MVEGTFGVLVPWSWRFSSFSFLARVHGQVGKKFGGTWAFLGLFRLIPAPKGVKQLRVCIMARWHISLWGFSLLLVLSGVPVVSHGLLLCCQVSRAGEQLIAGLG